MSRLIDISPPVPPAPVTAPSLEAFVGPARVIQCPGIGAIGPGEALWAAGTERALFRVLPADAGTGPARYAALTPDGARTLVRLGVRLFGTDALSVDPADGTTLEARRLLDAGGVAILEGLALALADAGEYELIALPPARPGADASPVRAVLRVR